MEFFKEGWDDGPKTKRDLKEPAKMKKDHILFTIFGLVYCCVFIVWEIAAALGSFLKNLILRPEPKSLKGRVCLVTGAGRGLGREFCLALAKEGAVIACADINEPNNITTAEMVKEIGVKVIPYTVNVAIKKDVEILVSKVEKELGPVYLLINNAAIVYAKAKVDEDYIRAAFNVNVMGSYWLMNAVLPTMQARNEGHIVNICSLAPKMVVSPLKIYGATKATLSYLSNCVRSDLHLADKNIIVTNVFFPTMNSSEDYINSISMKINLYVEMEEVVKATMKAIYYDSDEVFIPFFTKYPLILITEMLPFRTSTKLMKLVFQQWNFPNEEQEKLLPFKDIINECSLIEPKKRS